MFDVDMEGKPSGLGSSGYLEISVPFTLYSLRERNKRGSVPGGRTHPDIGFKAVLSYCLSRVAIHYLQPILTRYKR